VMDSANRRREKEAVRLTGGNWIALSLQSWATARANNKSNHCRTWGHCRLGTLAKWLRESFPLETH